MAKYYKNLFASKDETLLDTNIEELLNFEDIQILTEQQKSSIEGILTIQELSESLRNMKNGKTPGIDGFPAEFFQILLVKN